MTVTRSQAWVLVVGALAFSGNAVVHPLGAAQQPPASGQTPQTPAPQTSAAQTPAPPAEGQQPPPLFRTGINFVRVDAIVTDRSGNHVSDLKQSEFEVLEDGQPQKIDLFRLVNITGNPAPGEPTTSRRIRSDEDQEAEAAREDVRLFTIFLDDYHVRRNNAVGARDPLSNFVSTLGPMDLVSIMYPLTPVKDVRFSRNHESAARALQQFDGRKYDYNPRNDFEQQYVWYPVETVERIRNQVTLSALEGLVIKLGSLREGRKAVILVSEGFSNLPPPQLRDPVAALPGLGNPNRFNPQAGQNSQAEDRAQFMAGTDLQMQLREVYDAANKNNTTIYTLDPRGLAVFDFDINENVGQQTDAGSLRSTQDTLRTLAEETDGRAIVNRNDLEGGLRQVVRDSSAYYLLGYNSARAPTDGKFHEIRVRVKRPSTQVRARKGYWALTAADTAKALAPPKPGPPPAIEHALATISSKPRGTLITTWIGTARGENGKTRVTFIWEPVPPALGLKADEPAARVSLVATGVDGDRYFRGRVPDVTLASTDAQAAASATGPPAASRAASRVSFDVNPGRVELRLSVEDARSRILDTDTREIRVPDLTGPQVMLSTPQIFRARTVKEFQTLSTDLAAVPTVGREFRRTDRLLIRFEAYGPGSAAPTITARLLNRAGQAMSTLPVRAPAAAGQPSQVDLPLAALASGEYLIEIKAAGEGGDAQEMMAMRIVS